MQKILFLDTECTGDGTHFNHEILQIGAEMGIDGLLIDSIQIDMSPSNNVKYTAHEELGRKHLSERKPSTKSGLSSFKYGLDKHIKRRYNEDRFLVVCYSSSFDEKNVYNGFAKNQTKLSDYFIVPFVCTLNFSSMALGNRTAILKDRKLTTLCRALDIEVDYDKVHSALYDAQLCRQVYFKLLKTGKRSKTFY